MLVMDVAICSVSNYNLTLEVLMVFVVCAAILANLLVLLAQVVKANESWLSERLRPWMMHYRNKKKYALDNKQKIGVDSRMRLDESEKGQELERAAPRV